MRSVRARLLWLSLVVLFASSVSFSQNITALLTGTVTDPSGAFVP